MGVLRMYEMGMFCIVMALSMGCGSEGPIDPVEVSCPAGTDCTITAAPVTVFIPAAAIPAEGLNLTVTSASGVPQAATLVPNSAISIEPSGTTFNPPATVTVNYTGFNLGALSGVLPSELGIYKVVSQQWQKQAGGAVDTAAGTVSASISSLSVFGVLGAPVATVTVTPSTVNLVAGATQQLTADVEDADGNPLPQRPVNWDTSNPSAASVSSTGLVTAEGAGSADISAESESVSGSSQVTVTTGGGGGGTGGPHEPAGMTQVFYIDGTTKDWGPLVSNYGNAWGNPNEGSTGPFTGNVSVVNDGNAPNGKAVQVDFPSGSGAGFSGAAFINNLGASYREIYIRTVFMYNAGWQQHSSGTTKLFYYGISGQTSAFYPQGNSPSWRIRWRDQSGQDDDGVFQHQSFFTPGSYHELEIHHVMESSNGANDGYVRIWLNGTELTNWTNLTQGQKQGTLQTPQWSWHNGARFGGLQLGTYWGGSGDTKTQNDFMRWGEIYVSGK